MQYRRDIVPSLNLTGAIRDRLYVYDGRLIIISKAMYYYLYVKGLINLIFDNYVHIKNTNENLTA
jgi:hypothetical protein